MVTIRTIASELLSNPDLADELSPQDIPISEIKLLSSDQIDTLIDSKITTLGELASQWEQLAMISSDTKISRFLLEKICSSASLLITGADKRYLRRKESGSNYIKIVFVGLSAAGKSTIIKYLKRTEPLKVIQENLLKTSRPTVGLNREKLSFSEVLPVILWELGGQTFYRENILVNPKKYFTDTQAIVFIFDGHDPEKFSDALGYLEKVYTALQQMQDTEKGEQMPTFHFVLHKIDEGVKTATSMMGELAEKIASRLGLNVIQTLEHMYITSIYDSFSISMFFSQVMESITPIRRYIAEGLNTLSIIYNFKFSCLINPQMGRMPLGWQNTTIIEPNTIINDILELISDIGISSVDDVYKTYTIQVDREINEIHFMKIQIFNQTYFFLFMFNDSEDITQELKDPKKIQELTIKAIEPQLKFIKLAIDPLAFDIS